MRDPWKQGHTTHTHTHTPHNCIILLLFSPILLPPCLRSSGPSEVLALVFLVLAFVFDTVLNYYIDPDTSVPYGLHARLSQSAVGFFALFVWAVFTMGKLAFRIYVNQGYKSNGWPQAISGMMYLLILGCGVIYYWCADEKNVPILCVYVPPLVYFLIGLYSQWVKNDFHVILPATHRNPPKASWTTAMLRCGLPGNDYFMVFGMVMSVCLIVALGFALAWSISPWWIGAIVSWVLLVLITTVTPMVEYFHTFEFSTNMFAMIGSSVVLFIGGLCAIFVIVLDGETSDAAYLLLMIGLLYPILITFTTGLAKWHDDEWELSEFVVWTNFVSCLLLILLFFTIALIFSPWWIGGGFMLVFVLALIGAMAMPRIRELSVLWYRIICTTVVVLVLALVVGATLNDADGFLGFTVLCAICEVMLLCVVYYAYRGSPQDALSIHKHKLILYSPFIFPIYEFDTMARGRTNPLTEVNHRVWSIYALFAVAYIWGIFALFFISPTTVGLCVSSLAITGGVIFTSELMHRAAVRNDQLAESIDYLEEGSDVYMSVLAQCKWIATKNQLLNDTSLFVSTKQNRLALDIGIQTEAATPDSVEVKAQRAIIEHLEHIYTDQNWEKTHDEYTRLHQSLPKLSCCGVRSDFDVVIDGERVTRREAFRRCDALFLASAAYFRRNQLYELNLQQELIKSVEGRKYDRLTQIIAMIREGGNFAITIEYLQSG